MVNRQRLTSWLTTTFAQTIQPVTIQNTFGMSFLHSFSQWNKLGTKNRRAKHTNMNFPTVNRKVRKKCYVHIHLFYQETVTGSLATKYRLK